MRRTPPSSSVTPISRAPASTLFSSSSFSTEAGRSTTSPAAIWLTRSSGSTRMAARRAERISDTARVYRIEGMEILLWFWDLVVHLDKHLETFVAQYGAWVYALLFL